jgi:hypothetical protein
LRTVAGGRLVPALLLVALLLSGCGIFSDVTDSVDDLFDRAPQFDQGTALAYAATSPPSAVASTIAGAQQPISRAPVGDRVYLQYDENLVRVQPGPGGSTVLVDDYANGYRRWAADVSPIFGAQAPTDDDGK